ncbi:MAG: sulfurtransferase complex subunit TusB [Halioglobus sp.]
MILHTLNASPSSAAFTDCVRVVSRGDALVLMGDGVYAAVEDTMACDALRATGAELYLLQADVLAAGIGDKVGSANCIEMDEMVALTEQYPRQQAWY